MDNLHVRLNLDQGKQALPEVWDILIIRCQDSAYQGCQITVCINRKDVGLFHDVLHYV